MHLLLMGLGSSLELLVFSFPRRFNARLLSFGEAQQQKLRRTKKYTAHEWQQKVKHVIKG